MDVTLRYKLDSLLDYLAELESALVAFSGGVDSGVLLKAASLALPGRVVGVTLRTVLNRPGEIEAARLTAAQIGVEHRILDFSPLDFESVAVNEPDRCYYCKKAVSVVLRDLADELGLAQVLEGSHAGDAGAYRPGERAVAEAGILSPLKAVGLEKAEIRNLARFYGLPNWDRPSAACLATRFPYGTRLVPDRVRQVFQAEEILIDAGFPGIRARHHGDILRIEAPAEILALLAEPDTRVELVQRLEAVGFRFVTLDLAGYRSGVFDPAPEDVSGDTPEGSA